MSQERRDLTPEVKPYYAATKQKRDQQKALVEQKMKEKVSQGAIPLGDLVSLISNETGLHFGLVWGVVWGMVDEGRLKMPEEVYLLKEPEVKVSQTLTHEDTIPAPEVNRWLANHLNPEVLNELGWESPHLFAINDELDYLADIWRTTNNLEALAHYHVLFYEAMELGADPFFISPTAELYAEESPRLPIPEELVTKR